MRNKLYKEKLSKYKLLLDKTSDWLLIKHNGKSLVDFFIDNRLKKIAIYGYGTLGQMLYEELKGSDVKVQYIIDRKNLKDSIKDISFMGVDQNEYMDIDAIVITAIADFSEIEEKFSKKTEALIFSLEDIIEYVKKKSF